MTGGPSVSVDESGKKGTDGLATVDGLYFQVHIQVHASCTRLKGRAFTIVEAVLSTVIVAVMLVAALTTVGVSKVTQRKVFLVSQGRLLAESLMSEILQQNYEDPGGAGVFGCESGESGITRTAFDDVDDYDGWSSSPPVARDGTVLPNTAGWRRTASVEWVDATNPLQTGSVETGAKRVTVTAAYSSVPQATLVAIRTAHE